MIDKDHPARYKIAVVLTVFAIALLYFALEVLGVFNPVLLERDISMLDSGFFEKHKRFNADISEGVIPPQLPGPMDSWAGGEPKEIAFLIPFFSGDASIVIKFLESHDSAPPLLEIVAGGKTVSRLQVEKGGGKGPGLWNEEGTRSRVETVIPGAMLEKDKRVVIRSAEGSWVALESVIVRCSPSIFSYAAWPLMFLALSVALWLVVEYPAKLFEPVNLASNEEVQMYGRWISTPARLGAVTFIVCFFAMAGAREVLVSHGAAGPQRHWMLGGDEPEYMIGALSLWQDGDLNIRNQVKSKEGEKATGLKDYPNEYHGSLRHIKKFAPAMKGANEEDWKGRQVLIHRPGISAVIAPASMAPEKMRWWAYLMVSSVVCLLLSACLAVLAHDGHRSATLFAIGLAMALSPPTFFFANQVYPDPVFSLALALAAVLLNSPSFTRVALAALLVAFLPWFSDRAILPAAALGLAALYMAPDGKSRWTALGIMAAGATLLASYYYSRFGVPYPVYHGVVNPVALGDIPKGLLTMMLDVKRGILFQAPVFILAPLAFMAWWRNGKARPAAAALGCGLGLTMFLVGATWPENTGGAGPAGRYNLALVWLAFPAMAMWPANRMSRIAKWIMGLFLAFGVIQSALLVMWPVSWFSVSHPLFAIRFARANGDILPDLDKFTGQSLTLAAVWGVFFIAAAILAHIGGDRGSRADTATSEGEITYNG